MISISNGWGLYVFEYVAVLIKKYQVEIIPVVLLSTGNKAQQPLAYISRDASLVTENV